MIINLYAIKDVDIGNYAPPFLSSSDNEAKQLLRDSIQEGSVLHKFPAHYHLYRVGSFDGSIGQIVDIQPSCLCSVTDLLYRLPVYQEAAPEDKEVDHE